MERCNIATRRPPHAQVMHTSQMMGGMGKYGLRARRANDAPTVLLQGRVSPESRATVRAAAEASGVTMSYYLDELVKLLDQQGGMPLIESPWPQREELPIPAA